MKTSSGNSNAVQQFIDEIANTDQVLQVLLAKISKLSLLNSEG